MREMVSFEILSPFLFVRFPFTGLFISFCPGIY